MFIVWIVIGIFIGYIARPWTDPIVRKVIAWVKGLFGGENKA